MSSQVVISTGKRSRRPSAQSKAPRKKQSTRNQNISRSLVSVGQAFPKTMKTVLRYVEQAGFTIATNNYNQVFFKCNGLYDPADAIGGHQPYGFDTYAGIYNHYKVYKSKVTVRFSATDTARPEGLLVGVNITPGNNDSDNAQTKMEKQTGVPNYGWITPGSQAHKTIVKPWSAKSYFGTQKDEDSLTAPVTADPTELSHFCIWAQNYSGGSTFVYCTVTIDYYVEFIEPKSLGGS